MHTTTTIRHLTPRETVVEWTLASGRQGMRLFHGDNHRLIAGAFAEGLVCGFSESTMALGTIASPRAITTEA